MEYLALSKFDICLYYELLTIVKQEVWETFLCVLIIQCSFYCHHNMVATSHAGSSLLLTVVAS